jgi:hypothetical protein
VPDLVQYQLRDGPHAGEPISERGEVERLARKCQAADCLLGLDSTVVETRFNVVRSSVPHRVATVRNLRDYLRPIDQGDVPTCVDCVTLVTANGSGRPYPCGLSFRRPP